MGRDDVKDKLMEDIDKGVNELLLLLIQSELEFEEHMMNGNYAYAQLMEKRKISLEKSIESINEKR